MPNDGNFFTINLEPDLHLRRLTLLVPARILSNLFPIFLSSHLNLLSLKIQINHVSFINNCGISSILIRRKITFTPIK